MNNYWHKDIPFEEKLQKRIPYINIFRLYNSNMKTYKQFKRVKLNEFRRYLGINKTNRIVGFTPDYTGFQPGKPVVFKNIYYNFIKQYLSTIYKDYSEDFQNQLTKSLCDVRQVWSGSYDTSVNHLKVMLADNSTKISVNEIVEILEKSNFKWFHSPIVEFNDVTELRTIVKFNPDSNPGHYTSKLIGRNKGTSNVYSVQAAKELYNQLKIKPLKNWYLWDILAREKDIKLTNEEGEVGTRVVLNTEEPAAHLLAWFSQKITRAIQLQNDKKYDLRYKFDDRKYIKYYEMRKKFDYYIEADWKNFDATVDTNFILTACAILVQNLPNDELHKHIKYYIISSIITKYIVLPPGIVVELNRAVPSGHPFTTLVNCNINLIYWSLIGYAIYGDDYVNQMDIYVYGDDTNVFFNHSENLFKIDEVIHSFGLKSEPLLDKIKLSRKFENINQTHDFLKRRFDNTRILWNRKKIFDKLFYQSKKRDLSDQISLLREFINTGPFDDELNKFAYDFFKYVYENHRKDEIDEDTFKFLINYNKEYVDKLKLEYIPRSTLYHNDGFRFEKEVIGSSIDKPILRTTPDGRIFKLNNLKAQVILAYSLTYLKEANVKLDKNIQIKAYEQTTDRLVMQRWSKRLNYQYYARSVGLLK